MVYFDHNATTPLDPRVRDAMLPWLGNIHGNPSSVHRYGREAKAAVDSARHSVAALLGASPLEIVFTGSGTEANNAAILSVAARCRFSGHIVHSAFEHPSVQAAIDQLVGSGMTATSVRPDGQGVVSAADVIGALRPDTRLVCLMLANNELGTLQPVEEVAEACRKQDIAILCDAVQAVGKIPVEVERLGADFVSLGGHKFNAPLGAAALWVRKGVELSPLLLGGSQERRRRAGTENVPSLVGLGVAADLAAESGRERPAVLAALRDRFEKGLDQIEGAVVHGATAQRLPNTSHIAIQGIDAEALMIRLDLRGFAVSTGSACASGAVEPSSALKAMGMADEEALSSLRISFGLSNTVEEVDRFLDILRAECDELRSLEGGA